MENQIGRFAFQTGKWAVRHRKLRSRLSGCHAWDEFDGLCEAFEIMAGEGNVEDNYLHPPDGAYRATALRRVNPESGEWEINWFDQRFYEVGPPMRGFFTGDTGHFYCDDHLDRLPILVRFIWSATQTPTPRWEQAFSADNGKSWETNWVMDFRRTA